MTIFRHDATRIFARRPPNTRVAASRAGTLDALEPVIFIESKRFLLFTPCQSGLLLCAVRAPLAPVSESESCVILIRMRVLVACVARTSHTGAPVITSKYASSWRILVRASQNVSPGSLGPVESTVQAGDRPCPRAQRRSSARGVFAPSSRVSPQGEPVIPAIRTDLVAIKSAESV